jgi:hypothetical protein
MDDIRLETLAAFEMVEEMTMMPAPVPNNKTAALSLPRMGRRIRGQGK